MEPENTVQFPDFFFHIYFPQKKRFDFAFEQYDCWTIFLVLSGKFRYQMEPCGSGCAEAGDAVLCPPQTRFARQMIAPVRLHMIKFNFAAPLLPAGKYALQNRTRLLEDAEKLENFAPEYPVAQSPEACHYCRDIWQMMRQPPAESTSPVSPVQTVLQYLRKNPQADPSDKELAELTGFSVVHLIHLFREETGVTPHRYLNGLRIRHAKELLLTSGRKISEIAPLCGFRDEFYFSRLFRRQTGMTPTEYRKMGSL